MGYSDPDVYNQPEAFGLTILAELDGGRSYDFDYIVLFQHDDGTLFWAWDAGCSCPEPFEDFTSLSDLGLLERETFSDFEDEVMSHDSPLAERQDMIRKARGYLLAEEGVKRGVLA